MILPNFYENLRLALTETTGIFDNKLHQVDPSPENRSTESAFGKSMIFEIARAARSSGLTISRKSKNIFLFKIGIGIFRISHSNDGFFSAHLLASTAEIIFTSSCSVRAIKISHS